MDKRPVHSICFFASYYDGQKIPYYVQVYLAELKRHFTDVVFITVTEVDKEGLKFLEKQDIKLFRTENEGYDFGAWYKAMKKFPPDAYQYLALVNDSAILFKPLDEFMLWSQGNNASFQGMTMSEAVSKHIQSYFLVFKSEAIASVLEYFDRNKIIRNLKDVIAIYEVGLSRDLISKGYTVDAFVDNEGYVGEFSPYYHCINYHLKQGLPLIKKKIIFASYRKDELFTLARMNFNISSGYYIRLIKEYNRNLIIDFERLLSDKAEGIGAFDRLKYNFIAEGIKFFRPLYRVFKK